MNIELTEKQFRRLLDLVYVGNWVMNSTRGDDRILEYDDVESAVFAHCLSHGASAWTPTWANLNSTAPTTSRSKCKTERKAAPPKGGATFFAAAQSSYALMPIACHLPLR